MPGPLRALDSHAVPGTFRFRFPGFVATATALHVLAFVLAHLAHFVPHGQGQAGREAAPLPETEVLIEAPELPLVEPTRTATELPPAEEHPNDAVASREIARREPRGQSSQPPEAPPSGATPAGDDGWTMPPVSAKPFDLGLGRNAFLDGRIPMPPSASAPSPPADAPPPAHGYSRTGGLSEALAEGDRKLGLSRGGPVVSAAHDAVATSLVPNESVATIEIRFDREGHPTMATVVDSTGAGEEWNEAARAIVASLAARPLHIPRQAEGLAVRVRVEVSLRLPSGERSAIKPSAGVGTLGLNGDLSDISAHPRRMVSARIVNERLL